MRLIKGMQIIIISTFFTIVRYMQIFFILRNEWHFYMHDGWVQGWDQEFFEKSTSGALLK
jgi:hypothetical protein